MKHTLAILFILLLLGTALHADETGGKVALGVKGGFERYSGDVDGAGLNGYYDGSVQWWVSNMFGLSFTFGKGVLSAENGSEYYTTNIWNYMGLLKIKPWDDLALNPYFAIGYERFDIDPKGKNGYRVPDFARGINSGDYTKVNTAIPFGVGISYFLNDYLAIESEALIHASTIDYLDGYDRGSRNDNWFSLAAGISFYLGQAKDTDKDGIIDSRDKDPLHAEDMDGFQDEDGAPDPDNDRDGILDIDDKAPLDPEDHDGYMDEDGVPDPDNDGDGILDADDKCPGRDNALDTREDKDGFQDDDGCPDPDNDGDGIADADDACPDEAETMNGYEDGDGCPDSKPAVAVEQGKSIVLEGVTFATGSARLTESSRATLDKVVETLNSEKDIEVEIRGYTDNTGNYDKNVILSARRAEAVKNYLVGKGIDGRRIQTKGYGPENPIAPNDTPEGRAKNRRIEFYRIK